MKELITESMPLGEMYEELADVMAKERGCKPSEIEFVRKGIVAESKSTDEDERSSTDVISTGTVDRDNEILLPRGADLTHYRKNPQVLFGHDYYQPPIGKAAWVKRSREPSGIIAKTIYAATDFASEIWQLVKGGFLPGRSVGFIPTEWHEPDEKEKARYPERSGVRRVIDSWELLEYSIVPVPSNRESLQQAVGKGLSLSKDLQDELGISVEASEVIDEAAEAAERSVEQVRIVEATGKRVEDTGRRVVLLHEPDKRLDTAKEIGYLVKQEIDRVRGRI